MTQSSNGKLLAVRLPSGETKRLGKITWYNDRYVFTADVDPEWRDEQRQGWSINWAVIVACRAHPWNVKEFFLFNKGNHQTLYGRIETLMDKGVAGNIRDWGQNVTLYDSHWRLASERPRGVWLDDNDRDNWLVLEPATLPPGTFEVPDDALDACRNEMEKLKKEYQRKLWGDTGPTKAKMIDVLKRAQPREPPWLYEARINNWLKKGGPLF